MVPRLIAVCLVEAAIVALLAVQVFADREPAPAPSLLAGACAPAGDGAGAQAPANRNGALVTATTLPQATAPASDAPAPAATRAEVAAKVRPDDPVGILLTGSMRLRDGTPAQAAISATQDKKTLGTYAIEDGSYALVGLQPGEWEVRLRASDVVEQTTTLTLTDDAVQVHDFVLDASYAVRVRIVTADGADATRERRTALRGFDDFMLAGQRERFPTRLAPTDYGAVFVGDAKWDPQLNPKDGFAGTLYFAALPAHAALLQRHLVLEQKVVSPGQQEVEFVVDIDALKKLAASATVRVLDDTGAPLVDARVSLSTSNRGGGGAKVDAEGRAVLEGLSPGLLRCQIHAVDHETMYTTVRVEAGQRLDLGDVRLGKNLPLTGTVLDADGKPATAELTWTELKWRTAPREFETNRHARTEADGTFSLWGTGRGAIAVAAFDGRGNQARAVFENPPAQPVVLQLGKLCDCTVTRPPDPSRAFTVTLYDGKRRAIAARTLEPRILRTTMALPAGDYTFEVHDEQDKLVQSGALTFGATPCTVEIR